LPAFPTASSAVNAILDAITTGQIWDFSGVGWALRPILSTYSSDSIKVRQAGGADKISTEIRQCLRLVPNVEQLAIHLWQGRCISELRHYPIALTPDTVQPKDVVCVLFGSKVPIILRPTKEGMYQVVGECYIQSIMYGGAIKLVESGEKQVQTFKLI